MAKAMPPEEARALVVRIARDENFYPDFVLSVAKAESRFNTMALSEKGAFGLMQLRPETAQRFGVDLCKPDDNVRGGIRFLRVLQARYRNPLFILAAYNAGEDVVAKSRGVPPYPETVRFVAEVVNDFYSWPAPDGAATRDERRKSPDNGSHLIEPAQTASPNPAAPRWSDGFVMHVG